MPRIPVCPFLNRFVVSIFALIVFTTAAPAQVRNRITRNLAGSESAVVMNAHPLARPEFDQGRVNGGMRIAHAAMVFRLAAAQQAALEKLLEEQQDPDSPNYHKWLTPEQYAARFGMSADDLAKVSSWLKSQGLTVDGFSRARTRVFFSGTAAQVESVFRTELHQYRIDGETRFANATEVSVPMALSGMVMDVRGLDNFRPRPRAHAVKSHFTSHQTGNHFVSPGDFATIYNLKSAVRGGAGWNRSRKSRSWDRPKSMFQTSTPFAPPLDCRRPIFSWFRSTAALDSPPGMKSRPISMWNGRAASPRMRRFSTYTPAAIRR